MSAENALHFVNIIPSAILAGTMVTVMAVLVPMVARFPDGEALRIRQAMNPLIDRYQRPAGALATIPAVALLFFDHSAAQYACLALGIVGTIGSGVLSYRLNFPINHTMDSWSLDAVPSEFRSLQKRWDRYHLYRLISAVVGLVAFVLAALVR
jgi:uncharacterized membrane protein